MGPSPAGEDMQMLIIKSLCAGLAIPASRQRRRLRSLGAARGWGVRASVPPGQGGGGAAVIRGLCASHRGAPTGGPC